VRAGISCFLHVRWKSREKKICWILGYSRAVLAKLKILATPGSVKRSGGDSEKRVPCSKTSSILTSSLEVSIPTMNKTLIDSGVQSKDTLARLIFSGLKPGEEIRVQRYIQSTLARTSNKDTCVESIFSVF